VLPVKDFGQDNQQTVTQMNVQKPTSKTHTLNGNFTGAGEEVLVHRSDGFYLSELGGGQPSFQFAGTPQGVAVTDDDVYVGDFSLDGKTSLAVFDNAQQRWFHGHFSGSQLVWDPVGNGKKFQVVETDQLFLPRQRPWLRPILR